MAEKPRIQIEKKGHILVLDQNWHKLMEGHKNRKVQQLEKRLNKLLKEQGKVNTEYEGYKKLKKQMLDEIVVNMDSSDRQVEGKMVQNSRHIKDINKKFDLYEEKKSQLPEAIEAVNSDLLSESMMLMYSELLAAKKEAKSLEVTIKTKKEELKDLVGRKEDQDIAVNDLYGFMHDVAGFEALEQLDRYYGGDI